MHASVYHHVGFLQSKCRWDFQLPLVVLVPTPLKVVTFLCNQMGRRPKKIHLRSGALAPDFTMTSTVTPVVNNCPNNFICYRINDSQIQCLIVVKMDGFFSERMLLMTRLRDQCNPGKVEPSSTARSLYLANVRLVPSSFLSLDRFVAS